MKYNVWSSNDPYDSVFFQHNVIVTIMHKSCRNQCWRTLKNRCLWQPLSIYSISRFAQVDLWHMQSVIRTHPLLKMDDVIKTNTSLNGHENTYSVGGFMINTRVYNLVRVWSLNSFMINRGWKTILTSQKHSVQYHAYIIIMNSDAAQDW